MAILATDFDVELRELYDKSAGRLLCAGYFDEAAFEQLLEYLRAKSEPIKLDYVVSKQVLQAILGAATAIEGAGVQDPAAVMPTKLSQDFRGLLDIISLGEAWSDRIPGVPRLI